MRKINTALAILIIICMFSLVGCILSPKAVAADISNRLEQEAQASVAPRVQFVRISDVSLYADEMQLVYDVHTKIVYYYQSYRYDKKAASSLCPYYSENGYMCRYNAETKKIEEIIH